MKKISAALLDNPVTPKQYLIKIETNHGDTVAMTFTNKAMANQEYNRIRAAGVYSGMWIKHIDLSEELVK